MDKLIMTPGPTYVHEEVRDELKRPITNPDLDLSFYDFYKETCEEIKDLLNTKNDVIMLSGEGILGLEAACASLIEEGDKVLCIENGIFGEGFGDFVQMYGGEVNFFHGDRRRGIDIEKLGEYLKHNNNFKVATLVHCETPSGITNEIEEICKLLSSYGIITVVDAVSSIGGEKLMVDEWEIDVVLGASQKCLSAPPGMTFLSISDRAYDVMKSRKSKIRGFYLNLMIWQGWYEKKWFPYTQPISDIRGLRRAVQRNLMDEKVIERHEEIAEACRRAIKASGLELYAENCHSNTVTTVLIPEGVQWSDLNIKLQEKHHVLLAGAFGFLKDKVFRIGHMGENCKVGFMVEMMKALNDSLKELGADLKCELHHEFLKYI